MFGTSFGRFSDTSFSRCSGTSFGRFSDTSFSRFLVPFLVDFLIPVLVDVLVPVLVDVLVPVLVDVLVPVLIDVLAYLLTSGNCQGEISPLPTLLSGRFCASPLNLQNCTLQLHTCDRVAMLQLEICKFLAGDFISTYLMHVFIVN